MPTQAVRFATVGTIIAWGVAAAYLASLTRVTVVSPNGTPSSESVPLWHSLVPVAVGSALALSLPLLWRAPRLPVVVVEHSRLALSTLLLVILAIAFPVSVAATGGMGGWYLVLKALLLIAVPAVIVAVARPSISFNQPAVAWRWWAPGITVATWFVLAKLAPWHPAWDPGDVDPVFIAIAAILTALTAGVGEELFYRRWLQSRLEALFGAWAGILLASIAFGLMHLGSHGTGDLFVDIARVITHQGTVGLFLAILWWRYRNLTMIILAHILVNGWDVIVYLIGMSS